MKEILETIRKALISNTTLVSSVSTLNIRTSYANKVLTYPQITIGIDAGSEGQLIPDMNRAVVSIDIRTKSIDTTLTDYRKSDVYEIYDQVHNILHDKATSMPTTYCRTHLLMEVQGRDNIFDQGHDCYIITTAFQTLFSASSVIAFSGADGQVYASQSSVSTASSQKLGEFSGGVVLSVQYGKVSDNNMERYDNDVYHYRAGGYIKVDQIAFKPQALNTLFNISTTNGTLNDNTTACSIRSITNSVKPMSLQLLFTMKRTDNAKRVEIKAYKGYCDLINMVFPKYSLSLTDYTFDLYEDSNGKIIEIKEQS